VSAGSFAPEYDELRGDILAAQGKSSDARAAYERALAVAGTDPQRRELIEMKMHDLAAAAPAEPQP
jgi:predicted negative regulator of RcsB-dependent stress response